MVTVPGRRLGVEEKEGSVIMKECVAGAEDWRHTPGDELESSVETSINWEVSPVVASWRTWGEGYIISSILNG